MPLSTARDPFNIPVALQQMAFFQGLTGEGLFALAGCMHERVHGIGEVIVGEGTLGEHLYVVGTGTAEVVKGCGTASETVLAAMGPGEFFGEMGLIENHTRSATVRAAQAETTVFSLGRTHLERFSRERPREHHTIIVNIARALSQRLRSLGEAYAALRRDMPSTVAGPSSAAGWDGVFIFDGLGRDPLCALAVAASEVTLRAGDAAFREGEPGDSVWLVGDGNIEVVKSAGLPGETVLATLGAGAVVGEMCLIEGEPRSATVRARETALLHCLSNAAIDKFALYWPADHTRIIYNIARELSRRLRSLDTSVVAALRPE